MKQADINYHAADAATEFRRRFDLGQADPIRIDSLLSKLDLLTVFAEMSENFSGMAARFGNEGFLLINCKFPKGRQIFTICHELYHLFVQEGFEFEVITDTRNGGKKSEQEKLADAFAAELLMPEKGIQELLLKQNYLGKYIELEHVIKLEQYFQVSRQSMVYRLMNLDFIHKNENLELKYFSNVKESAENRGYEVSLYEPTKPKVISSDYFDKAQHLYKKEKIGLADYAQLLNDIGIDLFELLDSSKNQ
jgi:Zn-dependent peptidase ImmA (M78 family)